MNNNDKMNNTFNFDVSRNWEYKQKYANYFGNPNPITKDILDECCKYKNIIDIGCGSGKIIELIDKKVKGHHIVGLDISNSMIEVASGKKFSGNNILKFMCCDFIESNLNDKYDLIIMKNFLHHTFSPLDNLKKAETIMTDNGKLLFSVPSINYLSELFSSEELLGRFSMSDIYSFINETNLFPLSININRVAMTFDNFEALINYLKSIGTYAKIMGYSAQKWDDEFTNKIKRKFNNSEYVTGEYITCMCQKKIMIKEKKNDRI